MIGSLIIVIDNLCILKTKSFSNNDTDLDNVVKMRIKNIAFSIEKSIEKYAGI